MSEIKLKFPRKYEYLYELMTERAMGNIAHFIKKSFHAHGVSVSLHAPYIAGVYLYNTSMHEYDTIVRYSENKNGKKYTNSHLFVFILNTNMGVDLAKEYWNSRNMETSKAVYEALLEADEKYLDLVLETDKFYKNLDIDISVDFMAELIRKNKKLFEKGQKYSKFVKLGLKIYEDTGYEEFLPVDAKEVFLF